MTEPWWLDEAPARPIKVTGGIQINSARGAVARTWWSKRFLAVLEQIGVGGRMARGRAYARQGQIISLEVDAGGALAKVQGSRPRPYTVRVGVPAFGKAEWGEVAEALVADASYTAALLAGEMPHGIEEVFAAVGLSLFPASARDLALDCTCPDQAVPCKHLAAVCYVLAERFDADPFEILALRGRDRETLLAELRGRRAAAASARSRGAPLADVLDAFYTVAAPLPAPVAGPDSPPDALLDQIPPFPVALRGEPVTELLRPVYWGLGGA
jgi:uncharacterized Zn finger protein